MKNIKLLVMLAAIAFAGLSCQNEPHKEVAKVEKCLTQVKELLNSDNGNLWGKHLYGPIIFLFPDSKLLVANENDESNSFSKLGDLYYCPMSTDLGIANTSATFRGKKWATIIWDDNIDELTRNEIVIHESWHRIQDELGINATTSNNTHLDTKEGRVLLKYEFVALSNALKDTAQLQTHLGNALKIRKFRQSLFPNNNEDLFERHEGLAEYTGKKLCTTDENSIKLIPMLVAKSLEGSVSRFDGWSNSFAYHTGPAYGVILDKIMPDWRNEIKNSTLIELAEKSLETEAFSVTESTIDSLIGVYSMQNIETAETDFENRKSEENIAYTQQFENNAWLYIPNQNVNFTFNPNDELITYNDEGVIYKTLTLSWDGGQIEANNAVLRTNDWLYFIIAIPHDKIKEIEEKRTVEINGYKINLNKDVQIKQTAEGKYTLQ